jgi:peptide/nickel transport system ATP-binding protein
MYAGQIIEVAPADEFFAAPAASLRAGAAAGAARAPRRARPLAAIAGTVPPLTHDFRAAASRRAAALRCRTAQTAARLVARPGRSGALPAATRRPVGAGCRRRGAARAHAVAPTLPPAAAGLCCRCAACACVSPSASGGLLQRMKRLLRRRRWRVASRCAPARRWRWWANRAAARRPPARPSCNCCAARPPIAGQALLDGRNLFELQGAALRQPGRRCRSSSRTRSPR